MPIVLNQIGSFYFIELAGNPEAVKQQIALYTRSGVDGVTVVDDGARGTPFVLRSKVDCTSYSVGRATYLAYRQLIGASPVDMTWQDLELASEDVSFCVLNVTQQVLRPILVASGGLYPPSLAWLECDWTMIAVANEA